jgi:hypothetical protein
MTLRLHFENMLRVDTAQPEIFFERPGDHGIGTVGEFQHEQRLQMRVFQVSGNSATELSATDRRRPRAYFKRGRNEAK